MFNLQNMNDYEFELLCKDMLEIELNKKLRTYSKGKDGGIDISCFIIEDTVIQAKHYINSNYSKLLSSLKKELDKVKILSPKNYYICTPLRLTPNNITEIYSIFKPFMDSPENIYDGSRIDDFLEKHVDIIYKHYKLWLTSSNVLDLINNKNIFIDTEELMFGIEKELGLFVETKAYSDAIQVLDKENLIIIVGDPGVGKTTLSKMLLFYYSDKGYCVRYASDNSIKDLKKTLSLDLSKKEIILMDDFIGQHYLNLKEEQPNEIKSLISFILRNKNKKLILNSRITILNEALRRNFQLKDFLSDHKIRKYQIDLNQMPAIEKAKLFYNHIYFNKLPIDYFNDLKKEQRYINIINHKNYNPRIIEYVTKERNFNNRKAHEYYDYIINKLTNPQDVWEDEFNNRISNFDRVFMHTLYSLTDTFVEESILRECFNRRIKYDPGYDSTIDVFSECLKRLTESMVRIIEERNGKKIGVINPSINDYVFYSLSNNENEIDLILKHSIYIEQSNKISKINKDKAINFQYEKMINNEFLLMKTINKTIEYYYLEFILIHNYKDLVIKDKLINIISNPKTYYRNPRNNTSKFLCELFSNSDVFEFYNLKELLLNFDKMKTVFNELVFEDINVILSIYKNNQNDLNTEHLEITLLEYIKNNICEEVESNIQDNLDEIISNTLKDATQSYSSNYLEEMVEDVIILEIEELIEEKKNEIDTELISLDDLYITAGDVLDQIDYISHIKSYLEAEPDYYSYRDYRIDQKDDDIHHIFNRDYLV